MSAAHKLKALREAAGLSHREIADLLDMPVSSYTHYETRYKKTYLDPEFGQKVAKILLKRGIRPQIMQELLGPVGLSEDPTDLTPVRSPKIAYPHAMPEKPESAYYEPSGNHIEITAAQHQLVVSARVDKAGVEDLIRKLNIARQMLD